ncbi:MAG: hypothetical protein ACTHKS_18110, partial [Gaiellaceae bacterium]
MRPLGLTWPNKEQAWSSDSEFTVGPDLLAAPVDKEGTTSTVYLPPGRWIDLFSGTTFEGGSAITRTNGPRDFPLYLRGGAAIPDNFRAPAVWSTAWRPDDLLRPHRQGWLVALADDADIRSVADRGATLTSSAP